MTNTGQSSIQCRSPAVCLRGCAQETSHRAGVSLNTTRIQRVATPDTTQGNPMSYSTYKYYWNAMHTISMF